MFEDGVLMIDMEDEARRWGIDERIRFNVECVGAEWSDLTSLWTVKFLNLVTGEEFSRRCRVLISCIGIFREDNPLSVPGTVPCPPAPRSCSFDIPQPTILYLILSIGVESFEGDIWHSSQWNHQVSLKGKKVIVIGNGCSATQLIPEIIKQAESIVQIIRSQHVPASMKSI